jgi:hypothetical protein
LAMISVCTEWAIADTQPFPQRYLKGLKKKSVIIKT